MPLKDLLEDKPFKILEPQLKFQSDQLPLEELWTLLENQSMKEDQSLLKLSSQFTEMPHHLLNKVLEMNYWLLVLKLSIYWPHIQEEEKLDFSEELESEKLCSFKN